MIKSSSSRTSFRPSSEGRYFDKEPFSMNSVRIRIGSDSGLVHTPRNWTNWGCQMACIFLASRKKSSLAAVCRGFLTATLTLCIWPSQTSPKLPRSMRLVRFTIDRFNSASWNGACGFSRSNGCVREQPSVRGFSKNHTFFYESHNHGLRPISDIESNGPL